MVQFSCGSKTGLGVQEFAVKLFVQNEERKRKWTDADIAAMLVNEFPERNTMVFQDLRCGRIERVQRIRTRYNRGELTGRVKPTVLSHRYVKGGKLADPVYSGKKGVHLKTPLVGATAEV